MSKCNLLHLDPPHNSGNYHIGGSVILPSDSVKDLGIFIDNQIKFHEHSSIVAGKANRTLAVIRKSFEYHWTGLAVIMTSSITFSYCLACAI